MLKSWLRYAMGAGAGMLMASAAHAQLVQTPVPGNATVTKNGLQWAWAYPLPASAGGFDLGYQSSLGWRLPTAAELALAPLATDFMYPGANVPFNGVDPVSGATFQARNSNYIGDAACATPYFSDSFVHCDWFNGMGQIDPNTNLPSVWAGMPGSPGYADQLVVRDAVISPEPTTMLLLTNGLAFCGFVGYRRRRA
jgi:hypothetical protein